MFVSLYSNYFYCSQKRVLPTEHQKKQDAQQGMLKKLGMAEQIIDYTFIL